MKTTPPKVLDSIKRLSAAGVLVLLLGLGYAAYVGLLVPLVLAALVLMLWSRRR
jgi:hypothetical protein